MSAAQARAIGVALDLAVDAVGAAGGLPATSSCAWWGREGVRMRRTKPGVYRRLTIIAEGIKPKSSRTAKIDSLMIGTSITGFRRNTPTIQSLRTTTFTARVTFKALRDLERM